jgi:membrane protein
MRFASAHGPDLLQPSTHAQHSCSFGQRTRRILVETLKAFVRDNVSRLGAALAFYTTIAVAPLLVLAIAVAGFFFEDHEARQRVIGEIETLVGHQAGAAVASVESPAWSREGVWATTLGGVTLLFGAFGVFYHLQDALNSIWRVETPARLGWRAVLKQRLFSMATVMATGFLLLVSLIASAVLSWISAQTITRFGLPTLALQIANNALSFLAITFLFAVVFKLLPDKHVRWRHVWLGALVTALLFTAGKSALGLYLGRASVTSGYGASASLVVLLLWCYYASQIVFLGAEFTRVTSLSDGGRNFSALQREEKRSS